MLSHLLSAHPPVDGAATSYILPPERERYWLPAGREVKLFEDSGTQLYGTADSATGGRWIQSVRIARAGQTVLVIRAQPEGLLAVNSDLSALRMLAVDVTAALRLRGLQRLPFPAVVQRALRRKGARVKWEQLAGDGQGIWCCRRH